MLASARQIRSEAPFSGTCQVDDSGNPANQGAHDKGNPFSFVVWVIRCSATPHLWRPYDNILPNLSASYYLRYSLLPPTLF